MDPQPTHKIGKAQQSFIELGKRLGVSNRQIKHSWHIFKHMPIRENDKILFLSPHSLLQAWLITYGLASKVIITLGTGQEDAPAKDNYALALEGKDYLPRVQYVEVNAVEESELANIFIDADLVIGTKQSGKDMIDFILYCLISPSIPRMYLEMANYCPYIMAPGRENHEFALQLPDGTRTPAVLIPGMQMPNYMLHRKTMLGFRDMLRRQFPNGRVGLVERIGAFTPAIMKRERVELGKNGDGKPVKQRVWVPKAAQPVYYYDLVVRSTSINSLEFK